MKFKQLIPMIRCFLSMASSTLLDACGSASSDSFTRCGHIVDPVNKEIYDGKLVVEDGIISTILRCAVPADAPFILPGFIDSHVHIESSMVLPAAFARTAAKHGTVGVVCDPHEIANVMGIEGVELMIRSAATEPFHFAFGVPSCVPSCDPTIETNGSTLDSWAVGELLQRKEVYCLAEMMNYPGVLNGDEEVMRKIAAAQKAGKPVDGHAPGVIGEERIRYAAAGISTDHECSDLEEARAAIAAGMMVQIREGSAAKNYASLAPLIAEAPDKVMLCTDDSHPTDLLEGHIDRLVKRALTDGYQWMDILQATCVNPVRHYRLPIGLLQQGDPADFICLSDLTPAFRLLETVIAGSSIDSGSNSSSESESDSGSDGIDEETRRAYKKMVSKMAAAPITEADLCVPEAIAKHIIVAEDGSLLTGHAISNDHTDCQKLVCYNRYTSGARPAVAYIRGFHLQHGAFAQTIAHDCHNIVGIGSNDKLLAEVINRVIELKGGMVVTDGKETAELPLPIAGLLSPESVAEVAAKHKQMKRIVAQTGCTLAAPFITLGFMSLPVIPDIKLTDKGLFCSKKFSFIEA